MLRPRMSFIDSTTKMDSFFDKNIINSERLKLLKNDAVLINLARGGLIDEQALKQMLVDH